MSDTQSKSYIDTILTDSEKDQMRAFMDNKLMVQVVKKVMLSGIYFNGTLREGEEADPTRNFALSTAFQNNGTLTNEQIGQDLRACAEAIRLVESGFKGLEGYKTQTKPKEPTLNRAE